jgi:DUF917 family protein
MTQATDKSVRSLADGEALILGLGMFATGGGGLAERGRGYIERMLDDDVEISWSPIDQVDPQTLTCSVYGMGSIAPHPPMSTEEMTAFGVAGERYERPWERAVEQLSEYLEEPIGAIIPFELGPSNTLVAVDAAARTGRILVDGDYIGRALPKMSQALPAVLGMRTWPLTICDPWGNSLVLQDCPSPMVAERVGKMVSRVTKAVDMGASCSHAAFPLRAGELGEALVPGTLTKSLQVGRAVMKARTEGRDPVQAALDAVGGAVLFRGVVSHRDWDDTPEGYMEGTTTIDGSGSDAGSEARIWFQNEHHVLWRGDVAVAMSPDIIAVVNTETAEPISNTQLDQGQQVSVLGFRSPEAFRSGSALEATSPRHYGIDLDWKPIEKLNPSGEWG